MSLPVVYHPHHVTPPPDGHHFPLPKFRLLPNLLLQEGITESNPIYYPEIPSIEALELARTTDYSRGFQAGTLDPRVVASVYPRVKD